MRLRWVRMKKKKKKKTTFIRQICKILLILHYFFIFVCLIKFNIKKHALSLSIMLRVKCSNSKLSRAIKSFKEIQ